MKRSETTQILAVKIIFNVWITRTFPGCLLNGAVCELVPLQQRFDKSLTKVFKLGSLWIALAISLCTEMLSLDWALEKILEIARQNKLKNFGCPRDIPISANRTIMFLASVVKMSAVECDTIVTH